MAFVFALPRFAANEENEAWRFRREERFCVSPLLSGQQTDTLRVYRRLVLKLSKSGSGVWAPFPLRQDQNLEVLTPQNIQKKNRERKK